MIEIIFDNSCKEASSFGLTQWDKGQKLKIIWEDMPSKIQVHFSSRGSEEAVVTEAVSESGSVVVDIPDALLKNSADILVWLYLSENANIGESIRRGVLYVRPRAKPHTAIDDLEKTQQEIIESILSDINDNINDIKANGTESEYFPEYVKRQAENVAKKVIDCTNENTVTFLAASDAHYKKGDYNSEVAIRHMSQAMKLIAEKCPIDFAVYLGDMTSGGSDKSISDAVSEIMKVNSALHPVNCNMTSLRCAGSEDSLSKAYYRNGGFITSTMLYNLISKWNKDAVYPQGEKVRGYCYKDFTNEKLRVICLNTSDTHGKKLLPSTETATMSITQLQWLCKTLDLSAKSDKADWRIILIGHHPLDMADKFPLAIQVLEAYANGSNISIMTSSDEKLSYNFYGKNSAVLLGQFHGHLHNYRVRFITDKNIPLVAIPNAGYYDNNFYADPSYTNAENDAYGEDVTYNKTIDSTLDTAFCVIVLDKLTGKIDAIHYGAGVDRSITGTEIWEDAGTNDGTDDEGNDNENGSGGGDNGGDSGDNGDTGGDDNSGEGGDDNGGDEGDSGDSEIYVYTNLVPLSKTKAGNPYCSVGYMDYNALSSLNELMYKAGYVHTGYIPVGINDVIRIAGADFDGTTGNYIIAFNSSHQILWLASLTGDRDDKSGIAYTTSGVLVFTPSQVQTGTLTDMAYIRVSTRGQGANLVVTANEEIDGSEIVGNIGSPVVAYTNIVKYAMDKYGNTYGEAGSKNNFRLTSSGETESATRYAVVGYIEADIEAVVRVKGISFDGEEGSYLCIYDADYNLIKAILLTGAEDRDNGISYEGSIMKFVPADSRYDFSAIAHFRVSGIGSDSNLIITYCEEIR